MSGVTFTTQGKTPQGQGGQEAQKEASSRDRAQEEATPPKGNDTYISSEKPKSIIYQPHEVNSTRKLSTAKAGEAEIITVLRVLESDHSLEDLPAATLAQLIHEQMPRAVTWEDLLALKKEYNLVFETLVSFFQESIRANKAAEDQAIAALNPLAAGITTSERWNRAAAIAKRFDQEAQRLQAKYQGAEINLFDLSPEELEEALSQVQIIRSIDAP